MSNIIKDVYFKCPHCDKESYAYAEIDPLYPVSGGAGIINDTGKLVIDWDQTRRYALTVPSHRKVC